MKLYIYIYMRMGTKRGYRVTYPQYNFNGLDCQRHVGSSARNKVK